MGEKERRLGKKIAEICCKGNKKLLQRYRCSHTVYSRLQIHVPGSVFTSYTHDLALLVDLRGRDMGWKRERERERAEAAAAETA